MKTISSHIHVWLAPIKPYERHISAASMVAGFGFDNYSFGRVDHPATQLIIVAYLIATAGSVALLHYLETHDVLARHAIRWRTILSAISQFMLGGLWSVFLIFYVRSAVFAASWPFLLVLAAVFICNEVFREYYSRLTFTLIAFAFALFSYTIFAVPVFTGHIGRLMFLFSGAAAIAIFIGFISALDTIGGQQIRPFLPRIAAGAFGVFAILNIFYFTNVLPPLPLALSDSGAYHTVVRARGQGALYQVVGESQAWYTRFTGRPTLHIADGKPVYVYSAIFAPIRLSTNVVHRWEYYDATHKTWRILANVSLPITGGREEGYRSYTYFSKAKAGDWRVDINTIDGRTIGRIAFKIVPEEGAPPVLITDQK